MRGTKNFFKEAIVWIVVFTLVAWSSSIPFTTFIPPLFAAGGIDAGYTNDGGATPDVFLTSTSTPESIIKITAYDTTAGANRLNGITLQVEAGMNCPMGGGQCTSSPFANTDLGALTTASTSGVSLWLDDGDGNFEQAQDTLVSSTTATRAGDWTTQTITDPQGRVFTVSQTVFSSLGLTIPVSFSSPLTIFIAATAGANVDASPLHKFTPKIPQYGIDVTSASATDWPSESMGRMFGQITLGTEGSGDNIQMSSPLAISEVQIASSSAAVEFIEIYNKTDQSYDLVPSNGIAGAVAAIIGNLNLHIADCTGSGCTGTTTNPAITLTTNNDSGDDIPAKGYFLIASSDWNTAWAATLGAADATYDAAANGLNSNSGVYISASSTADMMVIDKVGWGSQTQTTEGMAVVNPPANGSLERKAYPNSTPTSMLGTDRNRGNGSDNNNNSADFITRSAGSAQPQNRLSATESETLSVTEKNIVINEILYNTATSSAWIELYNASSTPISINNWTLNIATSTAQIYTLPNVTMAANSFATVYWNKTGTNDPDTSDGQGSLYSGLMAPMSALGGDVTLKNDSAVIIDYIQYGGPGKAGETAAVAAGKWTSGDFQSNSEYGDSIARIGTTGNDFNTSADWMFLSVPTPNLPNTGGDSTAPDAATNVQLGDPDSSQFGLRGEDVRISWVPTSTSDPSFDRYETYLLPDGVALNTAVHSVYNTLFGQYMGYGGSASSSYAFTGGGFSMSFDSAGNALVNGSYRAYVIAVDMAGNKSAAVASAPAALAAENAGAAGADTIPPMIDHMPVGRAVTGDNLIFYARMGDDRVLATSTLEYRINSGAWGTATTTCETPAMAGNSGLRKCIIPWDAGWNDTTAISYYLRAIDDSGNDMYVGIYPTDTESTAKSNAVNIDLVSNGWNDADANPDLTGVVYNSLGNPIQNAFVIIDGVATTTATTTASGTFSFQDNALPEGIQNVRIIKDGYMEMSKGVFRGESNVSFYITSGYMSMSAGGSSGGNGVSWTAPMDGMMMAPTNIACTGDCSTIGAGQMPIIVGFFNQMNNTTIDDTDASNAGSNIYLTSDGNTKVSGIQVKYISGSNEARIYSATALAANTFYTVVITPGVKDNNGNPIQSNRPSGNYEFSFNTMGDNTGMWGGGGNDFSNFGGGGMFMPPYVVGTNPNAGAFNVPLGAVLTAEFSEGMDSTSINTTNIKLYKITNAATWTGTEVTDKNVAVSLDNTTKKIVTISHTALDTNSANNGWYEIRIMGAVKSQLGIWLGNPGNCAGINPDTCLATNVHYKSSFQVGSASDTVAPTIPGTYPSNNDGITNSSAVDVAIAAIDIGFSEAMNPNTINSQNITLKKGTVSVSGTVKYDPMANSVKFAPTGALSANSIYTLTITSSVTDLSGNALTADNIISFKTGSADTASPEVSIANGDDYQVAITFSEPMSSALQTDTANWAYSVLNPANYYINTLGADTGCATPGSWACSASLVAPYNTAGGSAISGLSGITMSYDAITQTVTLKGFDMCGDSSFGSCPSANFQIFVDNVKDRSNNTLTDSGNRAGSATHRNASRSPIQNSATTYGMLGPGGGAGMMMGGGGPGSAGQTSGPSMDMGKMGMFGGGAFPMNAMAGQTSNYMVDLPVTKALQDGMLVTITFPTSFNVSAVAKDSFSPVNNDMNEWNGGTVTFDNTYGVGGVASTTNNVITVKLDIATTSSNNLKTIAGPDGFIDFLHFDLKGIKNSTVAKDFGTTGYSVDVKTKSSDGALLENVTTMPFFITESGSASLVVTINSGDAALNAGTMSVYLGSPMTGPMEMVSTVFSSGLASSTFTNIPNGNYMIFTDPFLTIGGSNFLGRPMPEPITVNGTTIKTITLEKEAAGAGKAALTAHLTGNFSTGGTADDVDVFANSPAGFRVKTLTDVGSTNPTATMYLTEGSWSAGVGPAMPKGPMAGPPTMPDWMMPANINVTVGIETATSRALDPDADTINAAIGNTEPVLLNVGSTNNFQVGDVVTFGTGAAATTTVTSLVVNTSMTFTPAGNWIALPAGTDTITSVREASSGNNDGHVYYNISTQSLKQIQGFVVDDSGNALGDAEVFAYQPQGGMGNAHTSTDTAGKFTLKIGANGVWTVGAFKPGMPSAQDKSVEIKDNDSGTDGNTTADIYLNGTLISDTSNNNAGTNPLRLKLKRPGYTISGKVLNASSTPIAFAPVWAYQPSSWGHADAMTDASGNYILYVDAGTWRIEADAPGVGWMQYSPDVSVTAASQSNINLRPSSNDNFVNISGTVTIDGSAQANMPIRAVKFDANGNPSGRQFNSNTDTSGNYTISAPTGLYRVDIWTPQYGEVGLDYDEVANSYANINLTAATTTAGITVAAGDLQTISLQFTNGTASQTGYLHVEEMDFSSGNPRPTGYSFSTTINNLSATSTIKIKGAAAGKYYFFDLNISGFGFYMPDAASRSLLSNTYDCIKVTNADRAVYFTLPNASTGVITIAGTVMDNSGASSSNAWVWVGNPNSQFNTGTQSANDGTFSLTVPKLSSGNYKLGADKSGYLSPSPANISGTANSSGNTITLTANAYTISGYVYTDTSGDGAYSTSTEALPNAWVWAEETANGQMAYAPADANGFFSLGVNSGAWKISAGADGYADGTYKVGNTKTNITISGASQTGKNIALTSNSNWSMKTMSKPITPSSGGTIDDTATSSTGVKLIIPPNALGQSSNSGNVSIQETSSVTETNSASPLGGTGKTISATDNNNNAITSLGEGVYIDVELVYYKADIATMNIVDYSKLKSLSESYWDSSSNNWVSLSTSRKAYYKTASSDTEWLLYPDSATQTGYEEFIDQLAAGTSYYDYKLVLTAKTNHLTVFSATQPQDALYPASPTGLSQSSGSGSSVALSWTAVTTNLDSTAITDLLGYEIYRSADGTAYTQLNTSDISGTTYTDSAVSSFTSYYYKVTAADDGGNETALASSTALRVCSNKTVSNGTIDSTCSITCNSGYALSGNSCEASGGGGGPTLSQLQANQQEITPAKEEIKKIITETKEVIKEVVGTTEEVVNEFTQKIIEIASDAAEIIKANVNSLLGKLGVKRDLAKEQVSVKKYVKALIKDISGVSKENESALTNFVAYGTDTTLPLGEGERAGVVNSYKSAFGKLPSTETEWNDTIKIANGRWPEERNSLSEANAAEAFKKVYLRAPDRNNSHDDAAVTVIAYGLRPAKRNTDSEKAAIKIFKDIYGYNPKTATAWDIVRAIAYSGATR